VNEAYRTLGDPVERARYLLGLRGVDAFDETDTSLDVDFLERQLERRGRAAEATDARDEPALDALLREVRAMALRLRERNADLFAVASEIAAIVP
jgi:molecular chaperone HscB